MKAGKLRGALCAVCCLAAGACDGFNQPIKSIIDYQLSLVPVDSAGALEAAVEGAADGAVIALMDNVTLDRSVAVRGKTVTVTAWETSTALNRAAGFDGPFFTVGSGGGLVLGSPESGPLALDGGGRRGLEAESALVRVERGGALVLNASAELRNNANANALEDSSAAGGALYVEGSCVVRGASVRGNSSAFGGGGVVVNGGALVMESGVVEGNGAPHGGGVAVTSNGAGAGSFTLAGGAVRGNHSVNGGGVFVYVGAVFTMEGGEIAGNAALDDDGDLEYPQNCAGGGVCVFGGEFILVNGAITGNEANGGGGVFVKEDDLFYNIRGRFTMKNGRIGGNRALQLANADEEYVGGYGGGVEVYLADFIMENGEISGNTAEGVGGVYAATDSVFTMRNGRISGNHSAASAGGVYVQNEAVFTMEDGEISGNSAGTTAGGVYVQNEAVFTMENGRIGGNTAVQPYGNGMYINYENATEYGTFRISGAARVAETDDVFLRATANLTGAVITLAGTFTDSPSTVAAIRLATPVAASRPVLRETSAGLIAEYRGRFTLLNAGGRTIGAGGVLE